MTPTTTAEMNVAAVTTAATVSSWRTTRDALRSDVRWFRKPA
jgi:hypothetical protein